MIHSFAIVAFAALIHASFQLSVSMLTLLSGHAIGSKTAHAKLLRLTNSFLVGAAVMTLLVISFIALIFQSIFGRDIPLIAWAISCGLLLGLGVAVWAFYYRREPGTSLWLPRGIARYLSDRTKATKLSAEAFGLGLSSVVGELIFVLAPMAISALVLVKLEPVWQLVGLGIYTVISLLSLLIICGLVGSGHKLSRIQKWREDNKRFLQFAAGSGLLILGFYVYVDQVVSVTAFAYGGN
jgi:uncharacterized membrane protein (DUF485 family)